MGRKEDGKRIEKRQSNKLNIIQSKKLNKKNQENKKNSKKRWKCGDII